MARLLRDSQRLSLYRHARLGQDALRARHVEAHGIPHPRRQAATNRAGLLEEINRSKPTNRRRRRTRPQVEERLRGGRRSCGDGALPRQDVAESIPALSLSRRIAETNGDRGLSCRGVTVDTVRLEPPLLDGGNGRSAQDKVSSHNFQILDAAI